MHSLQLEVAYNLFMYYLIGLQESNDLRQIIIGPLLADLIKQMLSDHALNTF